MSFRADGPEAQLVAAAVAAGRVVIIDQTPRRPETAPASRTPTRKRKRERVELVPASVRAEGRAVVFVVPLRVYAGDNLGGGNTKARIGRAGHERKAVGAVLARGLRRLASCVDWLQISQVRVTLTRLGGRTMDAANVVAAMKYVQDTTALFLGRDDADPGLLWDYGQEPGGPYGVRIKLVRM